MPDRIYIEQADAEALVALGALVLWDSPAAAAMGRLRAAVHNSVDRPSSPESGEGEDWPEEVWVVRRGSRSGGPWRAYIPRPVPEDNESVRRYIPAGDDDG